MARHDFIIDFYHSDPFEIFEYLPVFKSLKNPKIILPKNNPWFDYEKAAEIYTNLGITFQHSPSENADAVITTQYHKTINLPEYRNAVSFRLFYAIGSEKSFNHNIKSTLPFDCLLVPGKFSVNKTKFFTNPVETGFPKYDDYFQNKYDKNIIANKLNIDLSKKTIFYIPTWSDDSSLNDRNVYNFLKNKLSSYNIIVKPHHVSLNKNQNNFYSKNTGFKIVKDYTLLGELFVVADYIICDALSGAFWESILISQKPTIGIRPSKPSFKLQSMEKELDNYALIVKDTSKLEDSFSKSMEFLKNNKEKFQNTLEKLISNRGSAAETCAVNIIESIDNFKNSGFQKLRHKIYRFAFGSLSYNTTIFSLLIDLTKKFGFIRYLCNILTAKYSSLIPKIKSSMKWVHKNTVNNGGIRITSSINKAYPEVTGYFIPTLLNWGERELAVSYKDWLLSIQNNDGSWNGPDNKTPYTFDTGQILKGMMSLVDFYPELRPSILRGCDWILAQQKESGQITTPDKSAWKLADGKEVPETIHLYALEPVNIAGKKWGIDKYRNAVAKALNYYTKDSSLIEFSTLSHFHAYILEALVDLGNKELAARGMENVSAVQKKDGFIPAYNNTDWTCSTGMFQYALIWYKLGNTKNGDLAFDYASKLQNRSGGFYGGYGPKASYFPKKEISWAVKYFFDSYYWKIKTTFNNQSDMFPDTIEENDGRLQEILAFFGDSSGKKILDAGCGKGRFLRVLESKLPDNVYHGIDISDNMLKNCPQKVNTSVGSILNINYPDNYFDFVFTVETLEHSIFIKNAIKELCRVLKPSGKIVIIDKNVSKIGRGKIERWEQWFSPAEINSLLCKNNINSTYKILNNEDYGLADKLFIKWEGVKK